MSALTDAKARIFVAGHRGLVGSALLRALQSRAAGTLLLRTRAELDLTRQADVEAFFRNEKPTHVFLAAAKVGGIAANAASPVDFLYDNLVIETNVIGASAASGVQKLLFLGSSCIYPKLAPQPLKEEYLLSGPLEPTNEWYAVAKIAGIKLCEAYRRQQSVDFISAMPTNLYGPHDNFDLETSHVLPALIRKFHEAKVAGHAPVTLWGSGSPLREFLHVDDLASACLHLMEHYSGERFVNVGYGSDLSIAELATLIQRVVGHEGDVLWDASRPDGTPRKLLDSSLLRETGWVPAITLEEGVASTYRWYLDHAVDA